MKIYTLFPFMSLFILSLTTYAQWVPHIIDSQLPHATIIDAGDIDNDGDLDIAANGSPYIRWYQNNSPDSGWTKYNIDSTLVGAVGIAMVDIDGDSLLDIVASGYNSNQVRWYKNEGGNPIGWHKYIVGNLNGAEFLRVDDIDGDSDPDIAVTGSLGSSLAWFENNLQDTVWDRHYIENGTLPLATNVEIANIDNDSDLDIIATGQGSDDVVWYKNDLPATNWNKIIIDDQLDGAFGICISDIDGNSTLDVVAAGFNADKVNWYSSQDSGQTWTPHNIVQFFNGARNVYSADIDGDDDQDIVACAYNAGEVVWFENRLPDSWFKHDIDTNLPTANYVCTNDINGDGEPDVLATGRESNLLMWYENVRKRIYPVNTNISNPYMIPSYDTLIVTTEFSNLNQHNFTANAIYISLYSNDIDSIALYDDGLHGDSLSNDGIWGGFIYPFPDEDFYSVGISSIDLVNGQYFYKDDVVRFTTAGPIAYNSFYIGVDTIPGAGDYFAMKISLENVGDVATVENISAYLNSLDTSLAVVTVTSQPYYGNLAPGEISETQGGYGIQISPNAPDNIQITFGLDIASNGYIFWSDTTSIFIITNVDDISKELPTEFKLNQNFPNPFNPSTKIRYSIPQQSKVLIRVFDVLGNEIETLFNEEKPVGTYEISWYAERLPSGVYFYQLKAGDFIQTKKMVLMK